MEDARIDALEEHARRQLRRGDSAGAVETLRAVLSERPDAAGPHALLAVALLASRRRHAARAEVGQALALDPDLWEGHLADGWVRSAFREHAAAREAFARATALAPLSDAPWIGLGHVEVAAGRRGAARAAYERALALAPGDPEALAALGELELAEGQPAAARARARAALAEDPEHEGALLLMGQVLLAEGRTADAREHALMVLRADPTSRGGVRLLCAVKARTSLWLGLWWRWNAAMSSLGDRRGILVLVALFVVQKFAVRALADAGRPDAAAAASYLWLAFAAYTWIGPTVFGRWLRRELESVRLRPDF